jgi:DNA-binding transcriptional LysR family regulator
MNTYQTFVTVVKLGSFSAAAKKLCRSPSAISKKIGFLEQKLNVQLFDRTTRTLVITEAGRLYYERCLDISKQISQAESELKELSGEPNGSITVTWPNAISTSNVVPALSAFSEAYPNIKVNVNVTNDSVNLIDESIDFAFRMTPLIDSSMVAIELFRITPVICATPEFVAKYGTQKSPQDLSNMPLLLLNHANLIQKFWKKLPGMEDLNIEKHHRVNDINAIYTMAKQGMGATFIFRHTIEKELSEGTLIDLMPHHKLPEIPVYLMYHKFNYTPKKVRVFIDFFKQHYLSIN